MKDLLEKFENKRPEIVFEWKDAETEAEWLFYQDVKSEKFWCHNDRYWSLFKDKFDLEYEDIQGITKLLVEEALKRELNTSIDEKYFMSNEIEEALKRELNMEQALNKLGL